MLVSSPNLWVKIKFNNYLCLKLFMQLLMIVIIRHFFYRNYVGLSLWPFIILKNVHLKQDSVLINHERIHLKQQQELFIIPFYFLYISEWLLRSLLYLDSYRAYQNISFEREAYQNEKELDYLTKRKPFSFINYLCRE